ncbi:MAG: hypothetical protein HFI81_01730 [Eubacterium sp.]|jgi:hypothetical protein|nr:hypothetical protein [Eubacterium sp.]
MGFFNRFRKRKREAEEIRDAALQEPNAENIPERFMDSKQAQSYIMQCCEQIIEAGKELEEEKSEYRIVTDYLKDIQMIEELPPEDFAEVRSAAENVQNLNRMRDDYHNSEKRISDVQFVQMQQEEDVIPDAINRLKSNEAYQNTVKRDMNYLEGEKNEWYYNMLELGRQQKILRKLSVAVLGLFTVGMAILFLLQTAFSFDATYAYMGLILLAAIGSFGVFLKMTANQTEIRQSEANMNRAIILLNKVKFRYVNVTNAVDYAREKFHVKNAYEFNYIWEQYLNELKEREKFQQANEDLDYYNTKLVRLLKRYRLYDANVWVNQSSALVDKKEMVEVKHNLIVRRQKLRSRIEYNADSIRSKRAEVDRLLKKEKVDTQEIRQIIDSIDRLKTG